MLPTAYASEAEADAYFALIGVPAAWSGASSGDKALALTNGSLYLDLEYRHEWKGYRATKGQNMDWPRANVLDLDGRVLSSTVVPDVVKFASAEAAVRHLQGDDLLGDITDPSRIKSESSGIGPMREETVYVGSKAKRPRYARIERLLGDVTNSGMTRTFEVVP